MLDRLQRMLRNLSGGPAKPRVVFDEGDHRVAAAGLLVHAMNVDGVQSPMEMQRLRTLLMERFSLDEDETVALIAAADRRDKEAVDFHEFTAVVKRAYNEEGRRRIVEMMWDVVFADGELHEFEDNMVWRVAEIIGVPPTQRILIRKSVADRHGITVHETGA